MLFQEVAQEWWDFKLKKAKGDQPRGGALHTSSMTLKNDVFPSIGEKVFHEVKRSDLIRVIRKIESRGSAETATKLCSYLKQIYKYAILNDYCELNIASNLSDLLVEKRIKKNHPFLDINQIPEFKTRLLMVKCSPTIKKAIWFMLYTGARGAEIRKAELKHFDLEKKLWYIPALHIKQLRNKALYDETIPDFVMPLSSHAIDILTSAIEHSYGEKYIFSSPYFKDEPINVNALNDVIRKMGYSSRELSAHGLRATLSTNLNNSGLFNREWIETQLTHADENKVRGSYNHAQYIEQRMNMMQWWGDRIHQLG